MHGKTLAPPFISGPTSPIPNDGGVDFQIDFDFIDHRLLIEVSDGRSESLPLER
jgi:Family of unknown function (DUF5996)